MTKQNIINEMFETAEKRMGIAKVSIKMSSYPDSVSRSYYAVFDVIRGLLELEKAVAKTHKGAIEKFLQLYIKTGKIDKKYSTIIKKMQKAREEADYKFKADIDKKDAEDVYLKAKEFINEVKKYLKSIDRHK